MSTMTFLASVLGKLSPSVIGRPLQLLQLSPYGAKSPYSGNLGAAPVKTRRATHALLSPAVSPASSAPDRETGCASDAATDTTSVVRSDPDPDVLTCVCRSA
ncbi:hypothetical protein CMUS01_06257 [Colletotrichum musicola]|uniref:Uncharacterized protein n=1 Tax=Colletotrichum musicola TaxID=2175873 RepID=A0A8H6NI19_9PEZI|nr:hypothetical protein CMUS01_06257 [Colletotrichum musicola]